MNLIELIIDTLQNPHEARERLDSFGVHKEVSKAILALLDSPNERIQVPPSYTFKLGKAVIMAQSLTLYSRID